jgi:hypothetical protein
MEAKNLPNSDNKQDNQEPQWTKRFIEVCVKTLKHVHSEHQIWGYGRPSKNKKDFAQYNSERGLEYADERTVCAAITQASML